MTTLPDSISLTHDAIAQFIGSNRVTVTRALRNMKKQGLIDYDRNLRTVTILDRAGLEALAAEQL
ncbi:MAG: helix-turn-helix domain-containing protein [Bacillota bacterium]